MESLRVQSVESAFQYDLELAIQRAAEDVMYQQQINANQSNSGYKKLKEFEDERIGMLEKIKLLEDEIQSLNSTMQSATAHILEKDSQIQSFSEILKMRDVAILDLQQKYEDEQMTRRDLEVELEATLTNRADVIHNLAISADTKASKRLVDISAELNETRRQLEVAERSVRVANADLEGVHVELLKLKSRCKELENVDFESTNGVKVGITNVDSDVVKMEPLPSLGNSYISEIDVDIILGAIKLCERGAQACSDIGDLLAYSFHQYNEDEWVNLDITFQLVLDNLNRTFRGIQCHFISLDFLLRS